MEKVCKRAKDAAAATGPLPASLPGASSSGPPKPVHALPFSQVSRLGRAVRGPRDVGISHV